MAESALAGGSEQGGCKIDQVGGWQWQTGYCQAEREQHVRACPYGG
jgi:hypothetical protein